MLNARVSTIVVNRQANAFAALLDGGYLRLYDGTQPATPEEPVSSQTKLAELRFASPAFYPAEDGVLTSYDLTPDEDAAAQGDAAWFRCFMADGVTAVYDGSAGRDGEPEAGEHYNLNVDSIHIQQHARVSINQLVHSMV